MPKKFDELLNYLAHEGNVSCHTPPLGLDLARQIGVPPAWCAALSEPKKIADQINALWKPVVKLMPRTCAAYAKHCVALAVVGTDQHALSLLYCFDLGKSWTAQRGFLPSGPLPEVASRFPVDLGPFYALHDGLVHFATDENGPLPLARWNLIPDSPRGGGLLEVLSEGGRGFGFDLGLDPPVAVWLDTDDEESPVEVIADTWAFLDNHMARRLERKK